MTALRVAAGVVMVLWWLPTITLMVGDLVWRRVRFNVRLARVRRLRRAGRLDEATAALDRLKHNRF